MNSFIEQEAEAWSEEAKRYDMYRERGDLPPSSDHDFFMASYMCYFMAECLKRDFLERFNDYMSKNVVYKLYSKWLKDKNGVPFLSFFTTLNLPVEGEENLGPQLKKIRVLFDDKINKDQFEGGGTLLLDPNKMTRPYTYKISENGKYPYIWINEVIDFIPEPKEVKENA